MTKRKKTPAKPSRSFTGRIVPATPTQLPEITYRPKPKSGESRWTFTDDDGDSYSYDCVKEMASAWSMREDTHFPVIVALYVKAHGVPKLSRKR